ncbi:MAG: hypothetical protein EOP38_17715 [Rubrivivax sp.]|nr:MAG: hypothetical protein EOP38_17715 [Rubrivivax sp.]
MFKLISTGWLAAVVAFAGPASAEVPVSAETRQMLQWVMASRDNQAMPFAIMDKKSARFFVFDGRGRMVGAAPALIGAAPGDHAVPGVGSRPLSQMKPEERTTPAGRFVSEPGRNLTGEDIVWVDYEAAFAIHRVRPGPSRERRSERLASSNVADHRVSLGCIVVDPAFYEAAVLPTLGRQRGVVYVLPETQPAKTLFAGLG